ncbi:MAG: class I SAM-dependent methyltransferase [Myxococcales bacterium]|nr:class I SAM-dependent methyltransferase [Myxococcales bacterium]
MTSATQIDERSSNQKKHESKNPIQRALIDRFHEQAIRMVGQAGPASILELGCGEGYVLDAFVKGGVSAALTGVELDDKAVAKAQARLGSAATIEHQDARKLAADGRRFEMVMMLEVLEHIPNPEQMLPIIDELSTRWLLLSVPWEPVFCALNFARGKNLRRWGNDPDHVNHWTRRGFARFIGERFEIVERPGVFPWTMVLARKR